MSTLVTIQSTDLITNSRADINGNFSALNTDKMETSVLDTDTTLAANSDAKIPSQKAVKAYVDAGGNVNASTTVKGIVEEATDGEVAAGTAVGATGARLFVNPSSLQTELLDYSSVSFPGLTDTDANFTSGTETALITATIPGGTLSTNRLIKGRIYVTSWETDDHTVTLTIRLKYGSTTICTAIIDSSGAVTADGHNGFIDFVLMADGSATAQTGLLHLFFSEKTLDILNATNGLNHITSGTATEVSSGDLTLQVTGQWSVGGAGRKLKTSVAFMEAVK